MNYLRWMGMAAKIQQHNEVMNTHTAKTLEYFRSKGFQCCVLKGQGIAKLYCDLAGLRQSGDIDVWVNSSRKELYELSKKELGKITGLTYHHIHYEMFEDVDVEAHTWPSFFTNPIHNKLFQKFCSFYTGNGHLGAGMNLHIKVLSPGNNHHMAEAMFKAFARALDEATAIDPRIEGILSTKGSL